MSLQQPISLSIFNDDMTILRESSNFDGYVPRTGEIISIMSTRYKVMVTDWQWNDSHNQCDAVHLIVKRI